MKSVLLELWPYLARPLILFLLVPAALVAGAVTCAALGLPPTGWYIAGVVMLLSMVAPLGDAIRTWRWTWRFARYVKSFPTQSSANIRLRYSPGITNQNKLSELLQDVEKSLEELTNRFGYPLGMHRLVTPHTIFASRRRRLTIYLLRDAEEASAAFGYVIGGWALAAANAILLVEEDANLSFVARHEMTHLLAHYWNTAPPPILSEGLATFLGLGEESLSSSNSMYVGPTTVCLNQLLGNFFDVARVRQNYFVSFVFVASLVHHFGWERLQRFYRKATPKNFAKMFYQVYGSALGDDLTFGKPRVGTLAAYATAGPLAGRAVEPSGEPVGSETLLEPGTPVLASRDGAWWRANVLDVEPDGQVCVRFVAWDASWNERLPRDKLQIDRGPRR